METTDTIKQQIYDLMILLKNMRKKKGLAQKDIAQKAGLTQQMISKIENCDKNPSLESFVKYCDGIGISLIDIFSSASA